MGTGGNLLETGWETGFVWELTDNHLGPRWNLVGNQMEISWELAGDRSRTENIWELMRISWESVWDGNYLGTSVKFFGNQKRTDKI